MNASLPWQMRTLEDQAADGEGEGRRPAVEQPTVPARDQLQVVHRYLFSPGPETDFHDDMRIQDLCINSIIHALRVYFRCMISRRF